MSDNKRDRVQRRFLNLAALAVTGQCRYLSCEVRQASCYAGKPTGLLSFILSTQDGAAFAPSDGESKMLAAFQYHVEGHGRAYYYLDDVQPRAWMDALEGAARLCYARPPGVL